MNKNDVVKTRDEILLKALADVPFDGWSWDVVLKAAESAGHAHDTAYAVFPGELIDVMDSFSDWADRQMLEALADQNPEDMRVRDRIRTAVVERYNVLTPHKDALRQTMSYWLFPTRKPRAAKIVWRTADRIWQWAGDTSQDYNRYTKRGLLSSIMVPTMLVWIEDQSDDMAQTKDFLDRRIENVMQLGGFIGKIKGMGKGRAA